MDPLRLPRQVFHISRSQVPACVHCPAPRSDGWRVPAGLCRPRAGRLSPGDAEGCDHPLEAMRAPGNTPRTGGAGGISCVLKLTRVSKPLGERAPLRNKNVPQVFVGLLPPHGARGSPEKSRLALTHGLPSASPQGLRRPR